MLSYNSQFIDNSDISFVSKILKNEKITQGPIVEKFEKDISKYVKTILRNYKQWNISFIFSN